MSSIIERNADTIIAALNEQNSRISELSYKIIKLEKDILQLSTELQKAQQTAIMAQMHSIGNGPTA